MEFHAVPDGPCCRACHEIGEVTNLKDLDLIKDRVESCLQNTRKRLPLPKSKPALDACRAISKFRETKEFEIIRDEINARLAI